MASRLIGFLGTISYSILQALSLAFGEEAVRGAVAKAAMLAVILLVSAACYRFIERPAQRFVLGLPRFSAKTAQ